MIADCNLGVLQQAMGGGAERGGQEGGMELVGIKTPPWKNKSSLLFKQFKGEIFINTRGGLPRQQLKVNAVTEERAASPEPPQK